MMFSFLLQQEKMEKNGEETILELHDKTDAKRLSNDDE